jgi:hypothetical protein
LNGLEVRTDATTSRRIAWLRAGVSRIQKMRVMRGVRHRRVSTVGLQSHEVLLRRQPLSVMSTASCDYDERLTGKIRSLNRTDSTANNAQPRGNASKTMLMRTCSFASTDGAATRTRPTTRPVANDPATINPNAYLRWGMQASGLRV